MNMSVAPESLDRLQAATLRILETTGVRFDSEQALSVLRHAGVRLDGAVARFNARQVEWALAAAPRTYDLYDREGRKTTTRGAPDQVWFSAGGGATNVLDWRNGQVRPFTLVDAIETAKLTDCLAPVLYVSHGGFISDVPGDLADLYSFAVCYRASSKPLSLPARSGRAFRRMTDIVIADAGGLEDVRRHPFCEVGINTQSPLVITAGGCDMLIEGARLGLPVSASGWPQLGATAPVTVAGAVVVAHAECLAGLVLAQFVREGTPYCTYGSTPVFDMRRTVCSAGGPERAMGNALLIQLARHIGLPASCSAVCTDAQGFGLQTGVERAMLCLSAALAGADVVGGLGWLDNSNIFSPELLVLDCEMGEAVRRFATGAVVDEETLALDIIEGVGPGGHFLQEEHTLTHFREAVWYPLLWRRSAQLAVGGEDEDAALRQRARRRIKELLDSHQPPRLSAKTEEALAALLQA